MHPEVDLGRQYDVLAAAVLPDRAADDLLGTAVSIDIRGVPEGDAQLHRLAEDRFGRRVVQAHSLKPRDVSPKLIQPNAIRLTFRPEVPRRVYCMDGSLGEISLGGGRGGSGGRRRGLRRCARWPGRSGRTWRGTPRRWRH